MAQSKATKKFEKNRLKDTLKRRKDFAKVKQRHRLQDKKKARKAPDEKDAAGAGPDGASAGSSAKRALEDMSVDDFFAGGFDIGKDMEKKPRVRSGKRKHDDGEGESDQSASVASVEDHASDASGDEDDLEKHKQELQRLSEKDPDFFKFLEDEDPELLDAAENAEFPELEGVLGDDGEATQSKSGRSKGFSPDVTRAMVNEWSKSMSEKQSLRALREVIIAFRSAVHMNDEDAKKYKYTITDADAYHALLLCALRQLPATLKHHMPIKQLAGGRETVPTDSAKFKGSSTMLKSHVMTLGHLLDTLSDDAAIRTALDSILSLVPYFLSFKKAVRELVKTVVSIWSEPAQEESIRITAFLILQNLVKNGDSGIRDSVMRLAYQGLLKGCRNTNIHTISAINLMKNTAIDLWAPTNGKDESSVSYSTAFVFIRSLALHIRKCIRNNANEAYKTVYNWQFVHSLDFWSRVLSTHCASIAEAIAGRESPLRPLIFPLVQVTMGTLRLIPTAAYFPLRFHCMRSLMRLSAATNTFIPLVAPLYEVLSSAEMRKAPKPATSKPLDFDVTIRASKGYLRTRVYQDGVGEQVLELLSEFFVLWAKHISFPELALPAIVMLKRWTKEASPYNAKKGQANGKSRGPQPGNRNNRLNSGVTLLVQKLEANTRFIEEKRAKVDFAPRERAGIESFLKELEWNKTPLGAFVEGQRKIRAEKRKTLEEARKAQEGHGSGRSRGRPSGDDEHEDMDGLSEPDDADEADSDE